MLAVLTAVNRSSCIILIAAVLDLRFCQRGACGQKLASYSIIVMSQKAVRPLDSLHCTVAHYVSTTV